MYFVFELLVGAARHPVRRLLAVFAFAERLHALSGNLFTQRHGVSPWGVSHSLEFRRRIAAEEAGEQRLAFDAAAFGSRRQADDVARERKQTARHAAIAAHLRDRHA